MRRTVLISILALVLAAWAVPASPAGLSVSVGLQTVTFSGDLQRGKYYDIPAGPGVAVMVGLPLIPGLPLELTYGRRKVDEGNSGEEAKYTWMEVGPRILFGKEGSKVRPDLFFGVGNYSLEIGSLEFDDGVGGFLGLGFQEYAGDHWFGRFQAKAAYFKSDTANTDAPSLNFALTFGYEF